MLYGILCYVPDLPSLYLDSLYVDRANNIFFTDKVLTTYLDRKSLAVSPDDVNSEVDLSVAVHVYRSKEDGPSNH